MQLGISLKGNKFSVRQGLLPISSLPVIWLVILTCTFTFLDHCSLFAYASSVTTLREMLMPKAKRKIKYWTKQDVQQMRSMAKHGMTGKVIAKKLKRSIHAVYMKASAERIRFGK
jgi:hypothetical protein